jgi:hypothetical protein
MKIEKIEYHRVHSYFYYDIEDEEIIEEFGSIQEFEDQMAEESEKFWEFIECYDYDRKDDWFTERKGGYEIEWDISNET